MSPVLIVSDTETTGPTPSDRIVELGWVEVNDQLEIQREVYSLIDPQREISFVAQGIHNITPETVATAPTLEEFMSIVMPPKGGVPDPVEVFCHNARFDKRYLTPGVFVNANYTCTLRLSRKYLPNAEDHKLQTLVYQYGLYKGKAHSALEDSKMALDLLRFIVDLSGKTVRELIEEMRQPQWVPVCPFKKYKDQPMKNVDRSYAQWALENMKDLDPDMEYTLRCIASGRIPAGV